MVGSVEQPVKEETVRNENWGRERWSGAWAERRKGEKSKTETKGKKERERERKEARLGLGAFQLPRVRGRFSPRELFFAYYSVCTGLELAKVVCC